MRIPASLLFRYLNDNKQKQLKIKVYHNDTYAATISWDGYGLLWNPGEFSTQSLFDEEYTTFEVPGKKIEKLEINKEEKQLYDYINAKYIALSKPTLVLADKMNQIIDRLNEDTNE